MARIPGAVMQRALPPAAAIEIKNQKSFHRTIFESLQDWEPLWKAAIEMVGDKESAMLLGIDQLGHFGPRGVGLVADRLLLTADGSLTRVVELGSGFGGALRQVRRHMRDRGVFSQVLGIELVAEHAALSATIGQSMGDTEPDVLIGDARRLPFSDSRIDALFVTGSASYIRPMSEVLRECGRVLRPKGVLVMTEEVGLRPSDGPEPGEAFIRNHPRQIVSSTTLEKRRAEIEAAGLIVEEFTSLVDWATPLLRQRVLALKFMGHCATEMFGEESYEQMVGMLTSAVEEYERGSIVPIIIVARQPS
jgi:SAM-dependent methyltransferase